MLELLTPDEIADRMKIDRRAFVRSISKQHDFPAPVRLGPRLLRWNATDIQEWLEKQTRKS